MTNDELDELERLAKEATPGPWRTEPWSEDAETSQEPWRDIMADTLAVAASAEPDAKLIAASREAIPKLITEVRVLREQIKEAAREGFRLGWEMASDETKDGGPNFLPQELKDFAARSYKRTNRKP